MAIKVMDTKYSICHYKMARWFLNHKKNLRQHLKSLDHDQCVVGHNLLESKSMTTRKELYDACMELIDVSKTNTSFLIFQFFWQLHTELMCKLVISTIPEKLAENYSKY